MSSETYILEQIEIISTELQSTPGDPDLLHDLGVAYYLLGEYERSVTEIKKALKQDPGNATYRFNLANSYSANGEFEQAKACYLEVIDTDPGHIPSLTNLADCYEATGDDQKAMELFQYVTRLAPGNALSYFNFGNFLLRKNRHIEASRQYKKAIEVEPSFTDAYHNLAWILYEVKAFKAALEYAEKGLDTDRKHEDLNKLAAKIKHQTG